MFTVSLHLFLVLNRLHFLFAVLHSLLIHCLLREIERLEVLAAVAMPLVHKPEQLLLVAVAVKVLIDELLYSDVAPAHTDYYRVTFHLHEHTLLSILVDAF